MPYFVPCVFVRKVCAVGNINKAICLAVVLYLCPCGIYQRSYNTAPHPWNSGKPP